MRTENNDYIPGVCNIGPAEIQKRKQTGWMGLVATGVLWSLFVGFDVPAVWRLTLFFPAAMSAAGFLQAYMHFCAYFGFANLFNFGEVGKTDTVSQAEYRAKDRRKAWQIILLSVVIGAAVATAGFALSPSGSITSTDDSLLNSQMLRQDGGSEISTAEVPYFENVKGFFAEPKEAGSYPGVVMIHEWWGLNENIKDMAQQLAGAGYLVLAVDLFQGSVAGTPEEALAQVNSLNQERAIENMNAAVSYLRERGATSLASFGWCFGGGQSLQLALARGTSLEGAPPGLDATVIYYGNLVTDEEELAKIEWPVLGIFGAEDQSIPVAAVNAFDATLDRVGAEHQIHIYPGVGHAFANPSGRNHAPEETKDAWAKTLAFLAEHLKNR